MGESEQVYSNQLDNLENSENVMGKRKYEKPFYKLETTMTFMFDVIKNIDTKYTCRQCSSCHGCR